MAAPTVDGNAHGSATATTTVAATLTTAQTNDIICALVHVEKDATALFISGVSGGGLTWRRRSMTSAVNVSTSVGAQALELWWAVAASALTAQTITATCSATFDDATIVVFGVHGCNTANPWDANDSLPAQLWDQTAPSFTGISTNNANDLLLYCVGAVGGNSLTAPSGFTLIDSASNAGGTRQSSCAAYGEGVTSTQSSVTVTAGGSLGLPTTALFEALTADAGGNTLPAIPYVLQRAPKATSGAGTVTLQGCIPTANSVYVVLAYAEQNPPPSISGVSGGGLTWQQRKRSQGSKRGDYEIWYAYSTGTVANFTITVTYAANFDDAATFGLAVAPVSSTVWDSNASLPANASNPSSTSWTPSVSGVATTQAHDLLIATQGTANTGNTTSPPTGWTWLANVQNSGGGLFAYAGLAILRRSSILASSTVAWGAVVFDGSAVTTGGEYIVDALTADASSGGGGKGFFMGVPSMISGAAAMRAYRALEENPVTRRRDALRRLIGA